MNKYQSIKSVFILLATSFLFPLSARAETTELNKSIRGVLGLGDDPTGAGLGSFQTAVTNVVNWGMNLAGVLVILSILYAAVLYLTSQGDESKAEAAKKTILWAIVGAFFVAVSKTILWVVRGHLI